MCVNHGGDPGPKGEQGPPGLGTPATFVLYLRGNTLKLVKAGETQKQSDEFVIKPVASGAEGA